MDKLYLVPDIHRVEESLQLINSCKGAFEYNDFYNPIVLDNKKLQMNIINTYSRYRSDFSVDTMHGAFLDVTIHSQDSLIREVSEKRIIQSMDIAKEMKLRGVVFHTGRLYGFRDGLYLDNWKKTNIDFFRRMLEKYPGQNIYIENMFDEKPDILAGLTEDLKEYNNFGICFDYAHAKVYGDDIEEWFRELAPYIKHMHINDNNLKDDLHLAIGEGKIDWDEFVTMVQKYSIDSSVLIEVTGIEKQIESLEYISGNLTQKGF